MPIAVPKGPRQIMGTNLVIGLPPSKEINGNIYTAIATYIDLYTKQAHIALTINKVDADGIANLHICDVFRLHRLLHGVIFDQGPQFVSKFIKALYAKLGINGQLMTAYHPGEWLD